MKETEATKEQRAFAHVKVQIDDKVFRKVMHWVNKSDFEVSGLGKVEYDKENKVLHVVDAILLPQKNTSVSTEIDAEAIGKVMYQLRASPRWWWHSHVNMGVFWSGTDLDTIKQLGNGGWFLSTVFNKRQEMKSAFCQSAPITMFVDDIETEVVEEIDDELIKQWNEEYEKNVENHRQVFVGHDYGSVTDDADVIEYIAHLRENNTPNKVPVSKKNTVAEVDADTGRIFMPEEVSFSPREVTAKDLSDLGCHQINGVEVAYLALHSMAELRRMGFNEEEIETIQNYVDLSDTFTVAEDSDLDESEQINQHIINMINKENE